MASEKKPGFWATIVAWFLGLFLESYRQQGRDEVTTELREKTDDIKQKHAEIDAAPTSLDAAAERMQARRNMGRTKPPED